MKHFLEHDLVHNVLHIDRGMIYTIKELFTRPGHSIREYAEGKRMKHFHFISFIIIILALSSVLDEYTKVKMIDLMKSDNTQSQAFMNIYAE